MVAGVATVSAAAMVVAPIAQPDLLPSMQRVSSAVSLTAFANPIAELVGSAYYAIGTNLLSQAELLPPDELFWPDSYYADDFNVLFSPLYTGLIPTLVNQFSFGGLSALVSNLAGYGNAAAFGLAELIAGPTTAIWNTPFALITAAGFLAAGQPELALAELQAQIVQPLVDTVTAIVDVAGYILDNVITNATTLITSTIAGLVANTIDTIVNGTTYVVQSAVDTLGTAVADLLAGQIEDAWNGVVEGLLGPGGTPGQIVDLTFGTGIAEVVDYEDVGPVLTVVIGSLSSNLVSASQRLGTYNYNGWGGIYNDWYDPFAEEAGATAAVEAAPAAAEAPAVAPAALVSAPESAAVEVDRPVAGETSASTDSAVSAADVAVADTGSAADADAATADASAPTTAESDAPAPTAAASETSAPTKAKATRSQARGASAGS
jgi:hypothetical protein